MRLRNFQLGTALMSIALVTTTAGAPAFLGDDCRPNCADGAYNIVAALVTEPAPSAPSSLMAPGPLTPARRAAQRKLPRDSQDGVLGSAYDDVVSILSFNNPCSDFFGGPAAVDIFNELVSKIRKDALPRDIGMRMSGPTTSIRDARTNKYYRIFDRVSLNSRGSFYRKKAALWEPTVAKVGTFEPNTKEARVLILLHELGHLIKGSDGQWLLPDDGQDEGLSRANSYRIENVCDDQIHSLGKVSTMKDLGKYRDPDQQPVSPQE